MEVEFFDSHFPGDSVVNAAVVDLDGEVAALVEPVFVVVVCCFVWGVVVVLVNRF